MTYDSDLEAELNFRIEHLSHTISHSVAVRSTNPDVFPHDYAVNEYIRLLAELEGSTRSLRELAERYLTSGKADPDIVKRAKDLVAESKAEIERFKFIHSNINVDDRTDMIQ